MQITFLALSAISQVLLFFWFFLKKAPSGRNTPMFLALNPLTLGDILPLNLEILFLYHGKCYKVE